MSKFQLLTSCNTFFLQLRISQSMKTDRFYQKNRSVDGFGFFKARHNGIIKFLQITGGDNIAVDTLIEFLSKY